MTNYSALSKMVLLSAAFALSGCIIQPPLLAPGDADRVLAQRTLTGNNPADLGDRKFRTFYYGSGTDKRRPEFKDSVSYKTSSVDASPFVSFTPAMAKSRAEWWGFGLKEFPLNARVWLPEGEGPFPLVLTVHGNHDMKDFSDPGYAWLGELLASRGMIMASIDENFLNGSARGENDARGWMLLKHLELLKAINDSSGKPLHGKIDLSRIALIGHSRGGEAVALAGAFNRLTHYPDDASVKFDFNFNIKSLVAIAPVDGQYKPSDKWTPVRDVNYLTFHGTHDGDVTTFSGLTQYDRVFFTPGTDYFKSAFLMYRANHGQWNTGWNNRDNGPTSARRLALSSLISGEDQRRFGAFVISSFLEATILGKSEYRKFFRDHRSAGDWLPPTMYATRYSDSHEVSLANFDENDIDLTTGSAPGVVLKGDSLSTWREFDMPFRSTGGSQRNTAVRLGWNNSPSGADTVQRWPARYTISMPDSLRKALSIGNSSAVTLSVFYTDQNPGPRKAQAKDSSPSTPKANPKPSPARQTPKKDSSPPDVSIELADARGNTSRLPLSEFGPVRKPFESYVYRRKGRDKERFAARWEQVLQTYLLPLERFSSANPQFNAAELSEIRLVFDQTPVGQIHLDDIGITRITLP